MRFVMKIKSKLLVLLQALWNTKKSCSPAAFGYVGWFFLCLGEMIYVALFAIGQAWRRWRGGNCVPFARVISVGNLTVGGTGKSVIVTFLVNHLGADKCAIVLRGYGRKISTEKNSIVSDGVKILLDVEHAGDEAVMHAYRSGCFVVVGADRKKSCELVTQNFEQKTKFIILDDAYQNHQIKKDCEILLLDARAPFDNGHCLPAGRLRERDCGRADIIMLTHADCISPQALVEIKHNIIQYYAKSCIFAVRHSVTTIVDAGGGAITPNVFSCKKFLIFAGIGSFGNFVASIERLTIDIGFALEFEDHHAYTILDMQKILLLLTEHNFCGAITTEKDWVKVKTLILMHYPHMLNKFFVAPVSIEFLSSGEYSHFIDELHKQLAD